MFMVNIGRSYLVFYLHMCRIDHLQAVSREYSRSRTQCFGLIFVNLRMNKRCKAGVEKNGNWLAAHALPAGTHGRQGLSGVSG
jgi:hypothetical protein